MPKVIIGHGRQKKTLGRLRNRPPHALIFAGPEHVGKKLMAEAFFWLLNDKKASWEDFCTTADTHGRRIRHNVHPDMLALGTDKSIPVGKARTIRRFVDLSPLELKKKLVLIDNTEVLGRAGFNTLLKTFEEPASDAIIILVTARPEKLPQTISSRAVIIRFSTISEKELLAAFPKGRKNEIRGERAWIAGRPGLAHMYIKNPEDPRVKTRRDQYHAFNTALEKGGVAVRLTLAEEVAKSEDPHLALEAWALAARQALTGEKAAHAARRLAHINYAAENLRFTNTNTRLTLEHALLGTNRPL